MFIARRSEAEIGTNPPSLSELGSQALRNMIENLLSEFHDFQCGALAVNGLIRSNSFFIHCISIHNIGDMLN